MEITIKVDINKFDISSIDLNKFTGQISEIMKNNFSVNTYTLSISNMDSNGISPEEKIYID